MSLTQQEHAEYDGMLELISSAEWRVWVKFQEDRILLMKEKLFRLAQAKKWEEITSFVAVIEDTTRQIEMFKMRLKELSSK